MSMIDNIREKYDPLYKHVRPHVTIVFPFESDITGEELQDHIKHALLGMKPFKLRLGGISGEEGGYIFLNVLEGRGLIVELHRRLYTGIISEYNQPQFPYKPHMTIGRIHNQKEVIRDLEKHEIINEVFEDVVLEIAVEIIDKNEDSNIEMTIQF